MSPQLIANALVASGYTRLGSQAEALGLSRSTTWTIVRAQHKRGITRAIRARMLAHPGLPASVRAVLEPIASSTWTGAD